MTKLSYKIGSFNIQKFGRVSAEKKDVDSIAGIIRDNAFDIVAIQEITNKEALKKLLEAISYQFAEECEGDFLKRGNREISVTRKTIRTNESFGYRTKHWEGRWAKPKSDYGGSEEEGYAFIWNRDRIQLVTNSKGEIFEPRIADYGKLSDYNGVSKLVRPPFLGRFMPVNSRYEIRLINTHIMYAAPSKRLEDDAAEDDCEANTTQSDYEARRNEFDILVRNVYVKFQKMIIDPSGCDNNAVYRVPYTFLLGDYNLNLSNSKKCSSSARLGEYRESIKTSQFHIITVNDKKTSVKRGPRDQEKRQMYKLDPIVENHLANSFDHFTYDDQRLYDHEIASPEVGTIMAFEQFKDAETNEMTKYEIYRDKISDHLPIYLIFDVRKRR